MDPNPMDVPDAQSDTPDPLPADVPDTPSDVPAVPADILPGLRLSASLVATEARLLPLEMPELLPGMPLAPPDAARQYAEINGYESAYVVLAWASRVMDALGRRCGRPAEYRYAHGAWGPASGERSLLPASAALPTAALEARVRQSHRRVCAVIPSLGDDLHAGALADALRTGLALLVLAGEVTVDEQADIFRRTFPARREVPPEEVAATLHRFLVGRYGPGVTGVRVVPNPKADKPCFFASGPPEQYRLPALYVEHDGTLPRARLAELRRLLPAYEGGEADRSRTTYVSGEGQRHVLRHWRKWEAALFPDGSAVRLGELPGDNWGESAELGNRPPDPIPRTRHEDVPDGAELVWFYAQKVSLHPQNGRDWLMWPVSRLLRHARSSLRRT